MKRQLQRQLTTSEDWSLSAVRAVLVNVDSDTVVSYYRQRGPTEHAPVWSVTKSVISILVGIAIDEGRLHLDQTLAQLLPAYADRMTDSVKSVTLRQLLTMTAGITGSDNGEPFDISVEDPIGSIISEDFVGQPGASFMYSNRSAHLVSAVLRHAVGRPILDYAREKLFDPLGIDTRPAWQGWELATDFFAPGFGWATDRRGLNVGAFGLKLTATDMLKIGQLYLGEGRWRGRQVVSPQWVKDSTANQLTKEQTEAAERAYGYFWWVAEIESHPGFIASGVFGNQIVVVPASRLVVVTAADQDGPPLTSEEYDKTLIDVIFRPILQT